MFVARSNAGEPSSAAAAASANGRPDIRQARKTAPPGGSRRTVTSRSGRVISASSGVDASIGPCGLRAAVGGEDRHGRELRTHDPRRRMRGEHDIGQSLRRDRGQRLRRQRHGIRRMIGVEPCPFNPSRYRRDRASPAHSRMFDEGRESRDHIRTTAARSAGCPYMKARHGTEEINAGDALHGRVDRCQRLDQADGDIVAVDIIALDRLLAFRPGDDGRRFAAPDRAARRECRCDRQVRCSSAAWRSPGRATAL